MKRLVAMLLCLAVARGVCGETVLIDGVAAYVNENALTVGDVLAAMQATQRRLLGEFRGSALQTKLKEVYRQTLERLIDQQLIRDSYDEKKGEVPEWVVDQRIGEIVHDVFDDDREALLTTLANEDMTYVKWRETVRDQVIVSALRSAYVGQKVRVSAADVRRAYDEDRESHRSPAQVKVRLIAFDKQSDDETGPSARQRADPVLEQLRAGEDFAALAQTHSQGTKAKQGGLWGWIEPAKTLRRELAEACGRPEAEASGVIVETDDQVYIVKVEGRRDAAVRTFDEVEADIEQDLRRAEGERLHGEWLASLRKNAYVKILDGNPF